MGYIDIVFFEDKIDLFIRVVRLKIMYIDYNVQVVVDVEDLLMRSKVVFGKEQDQIIVKEILEMIESMFLKLFLGYRGQYQW